MPNILYILATRERPEKAINCIENIISMSWHDDYKILIVSDTDDDSMFNQEMVDRINSYPKVKLSFGTSKGKINAINRDVFMAGEFHILCNHSDDMWFTKEGFDLDILEAFDNYKGLVHFPDQIAGDKLITYAMMHREYYNLDGFIYHPDFNSVYADNYQQDVAKKRGLYKFVDKKILEHRHSIWGFGQPDELLKRTENPIMYAQDKVTYERLTAFL